MTLPDDDTVIRLCSRKAAVDATTGKPTPRAFGLNYDAEAGSWEEFLSVTWAEFLGATGSVADKIGVVRAFYHAAHEFPIIRNFRPWFLLVAVRVGDVHTASMNAEGFSLQCRHEPHPGFEESDPHSGIHPTPESATWIDEEDHRAGLVRLYLFSKILLDEPLTA